MSANRNCGGEARSVETSLILGAIIALSGLRSCRESDCDDGPVGKGGRLTPAL